jgi:glycosyltransferase involved in cell wall biosynthesis
VTRRLAHLTTVDMSLSLLLGTELAVDVEEGWEVVGISAPGPYVPRLEAAGIRHVPIPALTRSWDLRSDLRAARQLLAVLANLRPDVLHTHNPKTGVLGRILGRLAGVPVVVNTCHGLWVRPGDRWVRKTLVYGAEAVAALASDAELYQNGEDRRTLSRFVPARKARTVGNGVDLLRFRPDPEAGAKVRADLGVPEGELLVGGVGRMVAEKGIHEFAEAARALGHRAHFVWVGPEDAGKPDRVGTADGLRLIGQRDDMPAVYAALDVFVLPSHREGFSRSAMEAAACGCAMALSDIRGCREIGEHERHLLLVPPHDGRALTTAIERLLDDPDLRARLGTAAQDRAHGNFDQRAVARASLDTYRHVAARKGLDW